MKIVSINLSSEGSTGKIIQGIHQKAKKMGHECLMMVPPSDSGICERDVYEIGNKITRRISLYLGMITGLEGCFSIFSTIKALIKIHLINPDIIHLHNLHYSYINIPILMTYLKYKNTRIIWTLHDCWSFTGHCPHFEYEKCYKWKSGCGKCPRYRNYPKSLFDNSKFMWKLKKIWFTGFHNLLVVTPSKWLADLVKESYLKEYQVKIINNGIDLSIFKYVSNNTRDFYSIPYSKKIVLGVAHSWGVKKGLDVFNELAEILDSNYQIILVGTNEIIDQKLNKKIISIHKTQSQNQLAEIYSAADVFVNPTREEVLGLTNIEANACGIPVITYKSGGSPECLDITSGVVVERDNIELLVQEIIRICQDSPYKKDDCISRAKKFDVNNMFNEYISLFEHVD